ncbi:MAG: universal stress protein [Marinoscillum sp.]
MLYLVLYIDNLEMQTFNHILIPTDFSLVAWKAVELGVSLASDKAVRLTLFHVYPSAAKFIGISDRENDQEKAAQEVVKSQMLNFFGDLAKENNVTLEFEVTKGTVSREISRHIKKHDYDLVIMGVNSHGQDNQPGSNTGRVISQCQVPVLIVPNEISVITPVNS